MKKRIFSALMALCLAFSISGAAFAESTPTPAPSSIATPTPTPSETPDTTPTPTTVQEGTEGDEPTAEPSATPSPEPSGSPEPSEVPDSEAENTVTEDQGTSVAAGEDEGGTEYTATLDQDGQTLNVTVTAPAGAFDAGVEPTLKVSAIEDEAALDAIAGELDGEVEYDGFAALDISFQNDAGEEIEPKEAVSVRIELPEAIVDSGIDLTTLAVQHLAEDAEGNVTSVDPVASVEDGTITLSDAAIAAFNEAAGVATMANNALTDTAEVAAVAEFEVDGFSYFTITWQSEKNKTPVEVNCYYYDENKQPQQIVEKTPNLDRTLGDGGKIEFNVNNSKLEIEGYEFSNATYVFDGGPEKELTSIEIGREGFPEHWYASFNGGTHQNKNKKDVVINLYYTVAQSGGDDEGDTGSTTSATVTTGKSAVLNDDGTYTLNLSVTGDRGSTSQKQKVDVLFILDESGSMDKSINSNKDPDKGESSRMDLLKSSVQTLVNTVSGNDGIDARFAAVSFARSQQGDQVSWTNANGVLDFVNKLDPDGGTNYQQGIYDGKQLLKSVRSDALTFVIFVSDGVPTYRGINVTNSTGKDATKNTGNGQDDSGGYNISAAVTEIGSMSCDYFYAIGMGPEFGQEWQDGHYGQGGQWVDKQGTTNLKKLANAVEATSKGDSNVYSASNTTGLTNAFNAITGSITFFAANNVTMTDPLSDYAALVPVAEGENKGKYAVTLSLEKRASEDAEYQPVTGEGASNTVYVTKDGKGETVTLSDGTEMVPLTVYVETNAAGKEQIRVDFAGNYELAQNYRYTVSTTITPSETAKTTGNNGTGDAGTGTHAGQSGLWSNDNDNAKVTFNAITKDEDGKVTASTPGSEAFPKPVIQVTETPVEIPTAEPGYRKYVAENENNDGTYDLSLDVTGTTIKKKTELNVLYVLDKSYSMMWNMDGTFPYSDISSNHNSQAGNPAYGPNPGGDNKETEKNDSDVKAGLEINYSYERYKEAVNAIQLLNSTLKQHSDQLDVQYALVDFAKTATGSDSINWKTSSNFSLPDAVYETFASGTNYVGAFTSANGVLNKLDSERQKNGETIVIFITDGDPNRASIDGSDNHSTTDECITAAKTALNAMPDFVDDLYIIGVSKDVTQSNLETLIDGVGVDASIYTTDQTDTLAQQFASMAAEIIGSNVTGATITDKLSDFAELVDPSTPPTITIKGENGTPMVDFTATPKVLDVAGTGDNAVYTGAYTFTENGESVELKYTYTASSKTFTLEFPDDYSLTKDWTYTITVNIQPTDAAYKWLADNSGKGPDMGGANTDVPGTLEDNYISSGKPGFYSNTTATLDYDQTEEPKVYPNPVIQVKTGTLTITKEMSGVSTTTTAQTFDFTISTNNASVSGKTYTTSAAGTSVEFLANENKPGTYTATVSFSAKSVENGVDGAITVNGLPLGSYIVTETGADDIGEYYCSGTTYQVGTDVAQEAPQAATVTSGQTTTVNVTNTYKPYRSVVITKEVLGDMGETDKAFNFTTSIARGGAPVNLTSNTVKDANKVDGLDGVTAILNGDDTTAMFTDDGYILADTDTLTISKLKDGDKITVSEKDANRNGYKTTYQIGGKSVTALGEFTLVGDGTLKDANGNILKDTTNNEIKIEGCTVNVTVTNTRNVVAPTGLESNHTAPYALMVTAAGVAGLALLGSMAARRRRRQE